MRDDSRPVILSSYTYDSLNRVVKINLHNEAGATLENPGSPSNAEIITYGSEGRVARTEKFSGYLVKTCSPVYHFQGPEIDTFFFSASVPGRLDSNYRYLFDAARKNKLVSRYTNINRYSEDGKLQERQFIHRQLDDPGTCWDSMGPLGYSETRMLFFYDDLGYWWKTEASERRSPDGEFNLRALVCYRREYDERGNTRREYAMCDHEEKLFKALEYNRYNQISEIEE